MRVAGPLFKCLGVGLSFVPLRCASAPDRSRREATIECGIVGVPVFGSVGCDSGFWGWLVVVVVGDAVTKMMVPTCQGSSMRLHL